MGKPGLGMFTARRKSSGNVLDDTLGPNSSPPAPASDSGGFKVLDRSEIEKRRAEREQQEAARKAHAKGSKFGRFSGFGSSGNKARNQSFDDDSLSSSKRCVHHDASGGAPVLTKIYHRDSKSSSGTQFSSNRPYNVGHYGSTSTLPSSADTDPSDNMFATLPPRPHIPQHNSSPNSLSMTSMTKQLPPPPKSKTNDWSYPSNSYADSFGAGNRARAMTTSSYASTAIAPKIEADLSFGNSGFDDMFAGLDRRESPDYTTNSNTSQPTGRSLLAGKRDFRAEPLQIEPMKLDVEPPLQSWESRGSNEHLMSSSPADDDRDDDSPPPPVPPHKFNANKYTPVASHSPELRGSNSFEDADARLVRQSVIARKSVAHNAPVAPNQASTSSSSAHSLETPLSSRSTSNNTTPKAALHAQSTSPLSDDDEDNLFAPSKKESPKRAPAPPVVKEPIPPPPTVPGEPSRRVMTAAEFRAQKEQQIQRPPEDSSDSEDYEDEEEAIEKRQQEQIAQRKRQQQAMARMEIKRTITAPTESDPSSSQVGPLSMGFSSEISSKADEWSDEDVPLGILQAHGFPNKNKPPAIPPNATPSYFRTGTPTLPDRPASAGAAGTRISGYRPPFARNLPEDPHASFIGGGLVRPSVRESMGFNRAASVVGEPTGMSAPTLPYHDPGQQYTSLVEQIHLRDMSKQKYTGGASSKGAPQQGPFTGALGGQMNAINSHPTRMPQMPMQGMPGMQGMMGGMGMNQMMMGGQMPMMGMNMAYPNNQQNELMQMQQLLLQQQMQIQQMTLIAQQQQFPQDPRMSMAQQNSGFQGHFQQNGFLNPGMANQQRPMSIMSSATHQPRPYSTPSQFGAPQSGFQQHLGPGPGYTPSIAPSERSNIGLSARYRPVVTGGQQDGVSSVSSQTLQAQASGGAEPRKVKGILKNRTVKEEDEDDWGSMVGRRNKFGKKGSELGELAKGIEGF
ncbi:hypothetical protein CC78DRAFT_620707 [Lojkania enalia]|uniref:Uncharacterized protein n=1 Tax=Lojkania enalia TaxID=147567 RepID=A0A9P4K1N3_9PLEO|nr:hypothetical protein CC78DRAFT_620707 [Didymosphaeria enalia]